MQLGAFFYCIKRRTHPSANPCVAGLPAAFVSLYCRIWRARAPGTHRSRWPPCLRPWFELAAEQLLLLADDDSNNHVMPYGALTSVILHFSKQRGLRSIMPSNAMNVGRNRVHFTRSTNVRRRREVERRLLEAQMVQPMCTAPPVR